MKRSRHEVIRYPASRVGTIDLGLFALRKHHIAGLLEIDVTDAIAEVRRRKAEGRPVSFFSWIVKAISGAIEENRYVHALKGRGNTTVVFDDVDISVMVEKVVDGVRVPLPLLIRGTNAKTVEEIHAEIQAAQRLRVKDESDYVLSNGSPSRLAMRLYYALPQPVRLFLLRTMLRSPHRSKAMMGTAIITSAGAAGHLAAWVIPRSMHNLCFALGSIAKKPWVVSNSVEVRDILHLTVLVNHDVVDGVPAARFIARLADRLQSPGGRGPRELRPGAAAG